MVLVGHDSIEPNLVCRRVLLVVLVVELNAPLRVEMGVGEV